MSTNNGSAQIKCVVTLMGDRLLEADLALRMNKHQAVPHKFCIYPDAPWFLQQIQDAANHLLNARATAQRFEPDHAFRDAKQVLHLLDEIMTSIKRGRTSLALPRKRTLEELVNNPTLEVFKPALPQDVALVFYIQAQKLVLALYQLYINEAQKIDISARHQIDCTVPWLNDTLVLFTLALQQCQALKDKVIVYLI
ncbi:DgyrCDS9399 [Dimorphilus gyrociliatus]|uniref:DgyrCDS9399 n=1 Tax=Dimorphilus gyrociliatus TaxID=2664684 RepID=A0A7I8VY70_9ANNE|nr:DgyrCDS9399 [Dimorphilus gyrociliatus]